MPSLRIERLSAFARGQDERPYTEEARCVSLPLPWMHQTVHQPFKQRRTGWSIARFFQLDQSELKLRFQNGAEFPGAIGKALHGRPESVQHCQPQVRKL